MNSSTITRSSIAPRPPKSISKNARPCSFALVLSSRETCEYLRVYARVLGASEAKHSFKLQQRKKLGDKGLSLTDEAKIPYVTARRAYIRGLRKWLKDKQRYMPLAAAAEDPDVQGLREFAQDHSDGTDEAEGDDIDDDEMLGLLLAVVDADDFGGKSKCAFCCVGVGTREEEIDGAREGA